MVKDSVPDKQRSRSFLWCVLAYIIAYLYGSIPLVYFLGRQSGENLKQSGSGNVGAANLLAAGEVKQAVIGGLFDFSKGCLPILACRQLGYTVEVAELAGVCGVVGQCWPIFLRFNGGRGLSTFIGTSLLVNRKAWVVSMLPMIAGALWRNLSSFNYPLRKPGKLAQKYPQQISSLWVLAGHVGLSARLLPGSAPGAQAATCTSTPLAHYYRAKADCTPAR